jgi:hypothetical protein
MLWKKTMSTPTLTDHLGNPLPPDMDLFAPAPPEIGPLISAYSTLRKTETPQAKRMHRIIKRAAIGGGISTAIALAGGALWVVPVGLAIGGAFGLGGKQTLTYVGKLGVARFQVAKSRAVVTRQLLFLFQSAKSLRRSGTVKYVNAIYTGTGWAVAWSDATGKPVCAESGEYYLTPKPQHPYNFWLMAERAWSEYLMEGPLQDEINRTGAVRFEIKGPNWVTVGPGFVELSFGGKIARCDHEDIEAISLREGYFRIKRKDAKVGWFSSTGVFGFQYSEMPNAFVFRILIERLLGVPMT